jgi:hypothetical protein
MQRMDTDLIRDNPSHPCHPRSMIDYDVAWTTVTTGENADVSPFRSVAGR